MFFLIISIFRFKINGYPFLFRFLNLPKKTLYGFKNLTNFTISNILTLFVIIKINVMKICMLTEYLRHVVSAKRISADQSKIMTVLQWLLPKIKKEFRVFLRLH